MNNENHKIHFKNLDGLRFIAAFVVLLFHSGLINNYYTNASVNIYRDFFTRGSGFGVDLFFSLSGFLITYLLIKENEKTQTISVKKFYLKRILRIWPLYFGLGIAGTLLGPILLNKLNPASPLMTSDQNWINMIFLFTFTVNFQINSSLMNEGVIGTLWSVCVEEQFYIFWAPLIKWFRKHLFSFLLVVTIMGGIGFLFFEPKIAYYHTICRFFNFGLGAIVAWFFYKEQKTNSTIFPKIMFQKGVQIGVLLFATMYLFNIGTGFISGKGEFFANPIVSTYVILIALQPNSVLNLENKVLGYLGKISYGIYMFHPFCVQIGAKIASKFFDKGGDILYYFFWTIPLILVVIIAALSYEIYEKPFLKLKDKYTA
jgi:peptidoglycan/LPS O-acetylase OafA/YrhL